MLTLVDNVDSMSSSYSVEYSLHVPQMVTHVTPTPQVKKHGSWDPLVAVVVPGAKTIQQRPATAL